MVYTKLLVLNWILLLEYKDMFSISVYEVLWSNFHHLMWYSLVLFQVRSLWSYAHLFYLQMYSICFHILKVIQSPNVVESLSFKLCWIYLIGIHTTPPYFLITSPSKFSVTSLLYHVYSAFFSNFNHSFQSIDCCLLNIHNINKYVKQIGTKTCYQSISSVVDMKCRSAKRCGWHWKHGNMVILYWVCLEIEFYKNLTTRPSWLFNFIN